MWCTGKPISQGLIFTLRIQFFRVVGAKSTFSFKAMFGWVTRSIKSVITHKDVLISVILIVKTMTANMMRSHEPALLHFVNCIHFLFASHHPSTSSSWSQARRRPWSLALVTRPGRSWSSCQLQSSSCPWLQSESSSQVLMKLTAKGVTFKTVGKHPALLSVSLERWEILRWARAQAGEVVGWQLWWDQLKVKLLSWGRLEKHWISTCIPILAFPPFHAAVMRANATPNVQCLAISAWFSLTQDWNATPGWIVTSSQNDGHMRCVTQKPTSTQSWRTTARFTSTSASSVTKSMTSAPMLMQVQLHVQTAIVPITKLHGHTVTPLQLASSWPHWKIRWGRAQDQWSNTKNVCTHSHWFAS